MPIDVIEELDRYRRKLLDISKRNRLINYRKTRARTLQIVDELPNQMFSHLVMDGKSFKFDPQNELESFLNTNDQSQTELPTPTMDAEPAKRHRDSRLQTELEEERLKAILKSINRLAKTAVEETGANLLYLAIGMLEWYESESSDVALIAPLILIPVEMERNFDTRRNQYVHSISHSGEELQSNLSLQKRLDTDGIRLPDFEDGVLPEEYFEQVEEAVFSKSRWRVKREALLGFFSFQKLLMYLDLDPQKWPEEAFANGSLIRDVFEGAERDSVSTLFSDDYDIDNHPIANDIVLVADADSSQHSALCDIIEGDHLVIEGPPGTGKSQTITNAIAAALSEKQTVLFVAEKLAALDVVKRNLEKLGLDAFCLELHSDKARPQLLYESLSDRMQMKFRSPTQIHRHRKKVGTAKKKIAEYLSATQKLVGPREEPLYEVFWTAVEFRSRGLTSIEGRITTPASEDVFDNQLEALQSLTLHTEDIGDPAQHPLRGWIADLLTAQLMPRMQDALKKCTTAASHLEEEVKTVNSLVTLSPSKWIEVAATFNPACIDQLRQPEMQSAIGFAATCLNPGARKLGTQLVNKINKLHQIELEVNNMLIEDVTSADMSAKQLLDLTSKPIWENVKALSISQLAEAKTGLHNLNHILLRLGEHQSELSDLGHGQILTIAAYEKAVERHRLLTHDVLIGDPHLSAELFLSRAESLFSQGFARHKDLQAEKPNHEARFDISLVPDDEILDDIRRVLNQRGGNLLKWFHRDYREACKTLRSFVKPGVKEKNAVWSDALSSLQEWLDATREFASESKYEALFGPWFEGCDTRWADLEQLLRWIKTARQFGLAYGEVSRLLKRRVDAGEHSDHHTFRDTLKSLRDEVNNELLEEILGPWAEDDSKVTIGKVRQSVQDAIEWISEFEHTIEIFRVTDATILNEIDLIATAVTKWNKTNDSIYEDKSFPDTFGSEFHGRKTDIDSLQAAINWGNTISKLGLPKQVLYALSESDLKPTLKSLRKALHELHEASLRWQSSHGELSNFITPPGGEFRPNVIDGDDPFGHNALRCLEENRSHLLPWANFCRGLSWARRTGLESVIDVLLDGSVQLSEITQTYTLTVYETIASDTIGSMPILSEFSRQRFEQARERFCELDRKLLELNREEVAANADSVNTPAGVSTGLVAEYTDMGLIFNEVRKQRRFCKIRDLMTRADRAVQALKPCFMMSPMAVAQYLPAEAIHFDLLIMDEASQIKPEDALGSILRADQVVVVGDPKQLPPTSFFDKLADDEIAEDEMTILDDTESILEVSMRAFRQCRRLRWHYRSWHESLIAFSNEKFYDNDLIVFPSPTTNRGQLGVRFHAVENATFVGGCNPVEAETVAQAIVEHAKLHPDESLGVGTFNLAQSQAIEDRLDAICTSDPEARHYVEKIRSHQDPLFIKNLENLQGDERDVIFISFTYGKDPASGRVANRFGPITQENGWRRLNVLVTRARRRLEVFSSMTPEDIRGGPGKRGLNSMRDYLEYTRSGVLVDRGIITDREPDSPFEVAVARSLEKQGFKAVPQVGVAGYYLDIGVLHPQREGEFLLGVECDGATYHSAKSARDRDRLRQEIIEARGWKLHRIWSTDWFLNQEAEEQRLIDTINATLSGAVDPI